MTMYSILRERDVDGAKRETAEAPAFFVDLNLDQVVEAITAGKQEYNLKPFFYAPLSDVEMIEYRHEVMRELEARAVSESVEAFAQGMRTMREYLAQGEKLHYKLQKERWFLDAADAYCEAAARLARDLGDLELKSRGFLGLREYVTAYVGSERFTALVRETQQLKAGLAAAKYCLLMKGATVTVRKCAGEPDYSADVEETFQKFKQGATKDYRVQFSTYPDMNHVEAQVLERVAWLYPETFQGLDDFCVKQRDYLDATLAAFDREVQFYVACLADMAALKRMGLHFCYPRVSRDSEEVYR